MPSISDELSSKTLESGTKAAQTSLKVAKRVLSESAKAGGKAIKGLCLIILDGGAFTTENVMKAAKSVAFKKTGDVKYSKNNVDISKLQKSGHVYKVDENVTAEVMKYFDAQCKKYNVKYSAMQDDRNPDKPSYMIFFEGKNSDLILHVIKEACQDYMKAEEKSVENRQKTKKKEKETPKKRESVKAKLAFFRDRVAARDRERDAVEKQQHHSDIQR